MRFAQVVGQSGLAARLSGMAAQGRVAHAQLLLGPEGAGALALALAYATFLLCDKPIPQVDADGNPTLDMAGNPTLDACGACSPCTRMATLTHPDVHFTVPTISTGSGVPVSDDVLAKFRKAFLDNHYLLPAQWMDTLDAQNKQPNITVAECQAVIRKLSFTAAEGRWKIHILWQPELLGEAGNVLLKLLEEPPERTLFLWVATRADSLLATITSRMQLIRVPPLTRDAIAKHLVEAGHDEAAAQRSAHMAGGSLPEALRVAAGTVASGQADFMAWARLCYAANIVALVKWSEAAAAEGREANRNLLTYGLHAIRECMLHHAAAEVGTDPSRDIEALRRSSPDEVAFYNKFAVFVHRGNSSPLAAAMDEAMRHLERNANPKLVMVNLSFEVARLLHTKVAD